MSDLRATDPRKVLESGSVIVYGDDFEKDCRDHAQIQLPETFTKCYHLVDLLGRGASGTVYKATRREDDRTVAIKFLTRIAESSVLERFLREGAIGNRVSHPNLVSVYETNQINGFPYIVSEFVGGGDLAELILECAPLTPDRSVAIILDVLDGLQACHSFGVVHRDLKPSNILIDDLGRARVADFGLARDFSAATITQSGQVLGTPFYMAPENLKDGRAGIATDIYSVGVILFEMLVGSPPFTGNSLAELLGKHISQAPPHVPRITKYLDQIVQKCLAKLPSDRPGTASDLAVSLKRCMGLKIEVPEPFRRKDRSPQIGATGDGDQGTMPEDLPAQGASPGPAPSGDDAVTKRTRNAGRRGLNDRVPKSLRPRPAGETVQPAPPRRSGVMAFLSAVYNVLNLVALGVLVLVLYYSPALLERLRMSAQPAEEQREGTNEIRLDAIEAVLRAAAEIRSDPTTERSFSERITVLSSWLESFPSSGKRPIDSGLLESLAQGSELGEKWVYRRLDSLFEIAETHINDSR